MALVTATRNISKAEDARNDTKLLMQPYANWEEFLTPAPISIAILGELVFISSGTDFSINKNSPKDGYKFIRYPESFRASLMQVTNSGWVAFNEAHKNMDQIRLHSGSVGGYVKMAIKILMQEDDKLIEAALPDQLENIQNIAEACISLSASTEAKFEFVIQLIQELMEACVNAKGAYDEELAEVGRKLEESKLRKQASEDNKKRTEEYMNSLKTQLEKANSEYDKAMNSIPTGWDVIGMNVVEGLTNTFTSLLAGSVKQMANPSCQYGSTAGAAENPIASMTAFSKAGQVLNLVDMMSNLFGKDQIKWDQLYTDKKQEHSMPDSLQKQFQLVENSFSKEDDCKAVRQCLNICKKAEDICTTLASVMPQGKADDEVTKKLIKEQAAVKEMAAKFDTQSKASTGTSSFSVMPPQLASTQQGSSSSKGAGDMASDNARLKIEQSSAQLKQVQEMMQKASDDMQKNQKELTDILVTMQICQVKEIDFKTTIKVLVKGLDAMGKVKEQWEKMVRFFQMISNIIKTSLSTSLQDFVKTAAKANDMNLGYTAKKFMKDMLYQQAFYSSNIASLVNMISGTYTEVSNRYLMDRISSLGKLMGIDPSMPEFNTERRKLQDGCTEAQDGIKSLVLKNKSDFDKNSKERIAKIERELQAALPPASEEQIKQIKETVSNGMKELTEKEEDQFA
jgi:hypothetical protein